MYRREVKLKQEAKQLNWCRSSINKEWYENKQDWAKATINWNKATDEMWTIFSEEEEH